MYLAMGQIFPETVIFLSFYEDDMLPFLPRYLIVFGLRLEFLRYAVSP
jgi:hypothetical protein